MSDWAYVEHRIEQLMPDGTERGVMKSVVALAIEDAFAAGAAAGRADGDKLAALLWRARNQMQILYREFETKRNPEPWKRDPLWLEIDATLAARAAAAQPQTDDGKEQAG